MSQLYYSVVNNYEPFDSMNAIHDISNNIQSLNNENKKINKNKKEIENDINEIKSNPGYHLQYTELVENKKFEQMERDYKSQILQDKFLLGLGGIAFASLIVLATQI